MENEENGGGLVQAALLGCPIILVMVMVAIILISVIGFTVLSTLGGAATETHSEQTTTEQAHQDAATAEATVEILIITPEATALVTPEATALVTPEATALVTPEATATGQ